MLALAGHRGAARAVAYLPDGRLASGGQDGRVLLHSPAGGPALLLHKSPRPVYAVAVRPGGGQLAFAGRLIADDPLNPVHLVTLPAGVVAGTLSCGVEHGYWVPPAGGLPRREVGPVPASVWALDWSADGRYLVAAARRPGGGNVPDGAGGRWWDRSTGDDGPLPGDAYSARFAPSGYALAVCRFQAVEGYAAPHAPGPGWRLPATISWPAAVAFAPDGGRVAVASGSFLLVDDGRRVRPARLKTTLRTITGVAFSPDGRSLLAGGSPGGLEVWDVAAGERRAAYDFGLGVVHAVAVAPDGLTAAAAAAGGLAAFDV